MEIINKKTIKLSKELNKLDKLVLKFVRILARHTDYVIVSGYVAILFGRSRATEDIDVFINDIGADKFQKLCSELYRKGFWCLNEEEPTEIYNILIEGMAVRFAIKHDIIPNFEIKLAKSDAARNALKTKIKVIMRGGGIYISSIKEQIEFKRLYLKSDKDLEDAKHLEKVFKDELV
jgi:hypothetical protein